MIFKLDGEVGELLALIPIIREWRVRNNNQKVFVETNNPDIFKDNPDIEKAGINIPMSGDYYDMNLVRWHETGLPVVEVYAKMVFGDKNLKSWKMEMFHNSSEEEIAKLLVSKTNKKIVVVSLSNSVLSDDSRIGICNVLGELGYEIKNVSKNGVVSWGVIHAAIGMADLFVGSDGDISAIALTTSTPSIVCYSYRTPVCFPPFRGSIPFVGLVPSRGLCEHSHVCHSRHSRVEWSKFYSQDCVSKDPFCCQSRDLKNDLKEAVGRIFDKA